MPRKARRRKASKLPKRPFTGVRPAEIVQPSRLFSLPPELRNIIWSFVFNFDLNGHPTNSQKFAIRGDRDPGPWNIILQHQPRTSRKARLLKSCDTSSDAAAGLPTTCRRAYAETRHLYFANTEIIIRIPRVVLKRGEHKSDKARDLFFSSPPRLSPALMQRVRFVTLDVGRLDDFVLGPEYEPYVPLERLTVIREAEPNGEVFPGGRRDLCVAGWWFGHYSSTLQMEIAHWLEICRRFGSLAGEWELVTGPCRGTIDELANCAFDYLINRGYDGSFLFGLEDDSMGRMRYVANKT